MKLIELEEVDSTNDYLKREYKNLPTQVCVTAKHQTKGRGRKGHVWESHANENLIMSFLFKDFHKIEDAWKMTQLATCSVVGLLDRNRIKATIKWPNDIVINGKKICGILTEMYPSADGSFFLVIGTGINVNQKEFPEEVKKTADSLALELGTDVDREVLLASVLRHFLDCYDSFLETMDLRGQKELYESFLVNKGRVVEVLDPKGEWQGTAIGIEKTGELLVQRKDSSVEAVYAGEVSVRGIYGYV